MRDYVVVLEMYVDHDQQISHELVKVITLYRMSFAFISTVMQLPYLSGYKTGVLSPQNDFK